MRCSSPVGGCSGSSLADWHARGTTANPSASAPSNEVEWRRIALSTDEELRKLISASLVEVDDLAVGAHDSTPQVRIRYTLANEFRGPIAHQRHESAARIETAELRQRLLRVERQLVGFGPRHALAGLDGHECIRQTVGDLREVGPLVQLEHRPTTDEYAVISLARLHRGRGDDVELRHERDELLVVLAVPGLIEVELL